MSSPLNLFWADKTNGRKKTIKSNTATLFIFYNFKFKFSFKPKIINYKGIPIDEN